MAIDPAELRARLRGAGLRATEPRQAVLAVLVERAAPISHPELVERLAPHGWDRATLYRNLTDLAGAGLLRRVDHGDHVWRYELGGHDPEHAHFVCTSCGDVACLPEVTLAVPAGANRPRSLAGGRVAIRLHGECDDCAQPEP